MKPTRLNVLVVLQKRIIRIINIGSKYDHTLPLFAKSKQLKLVDINMLSIATFMQYYERGLDDLWVVGTTWASKEIGTIFFMYFNIEQSKQVTRI